jgi:hypothetical protein
LILFHLYINVNKFHRERLPTRRRHTSNFPLMQTCLFRTLASVGCLVFELGNDRTAPYMSNMFARRKLTSRRQRLTHLSGVLEETATHPRRRLSLSSPTTPPSELFISRSRQTSVNSSSSTRRLHSSGVDNCIHLDDTISLVRDRSLDLAYISLGVRILCFSIRTDCCGRTCLPLYRII